MNLATEFILLALVFNTLYWSRSTVSKRCLINKCKLKVIKKCAKKPHEMSHYVYLQPFFHGLDWQKYPGCIHPLGVYCIICKACYYKWGSSLCTLTVTSLSYFGKSNNVWSILRIRQDFLAVWEKNLMRSAKRRNFPAFFSMSGKFLTRILHSRQNSFRAFSLCAKILNSLHMDLLILLQEICVPILGICKWNFRSLQCVWQLLKPNCKCNQGVLAHLCPVIKHAVAGPLTCSALWRKEHSSASPS